MSHEERSIYDLGSGAIGILEAEIVRLNAELKAARALGEWANNRRYWTCGICPACGFGRKLDGSEFHGSGCAIAAYNEATIGEQNTTIGYQDAMLDKLRAVLRDTIYRVEDVLEGAAIDDGIVSVAALTRLDEYYFQVLKSLRGTT